MNKIISFFDSVSKFLCGIASDKYAHLLVSLVATFILGYIIHWFNTPMDIAGGMAACAVFILGFFKEWIDEFRDNGTGFGYADIVANAIGCLIGVIVTIF